MGMWRSLPIFSLKSFKTEAGNHQILPSDAGSIR